MLSHLDLGHETVVHNLPIDHIIDATPTIIQAVTLITLVVYSFCVRKAAYLSTKRVRLYGHMPTQPATIPRYSTCKHRSFHSEYRK
ncbi:hypothetical protein N7533_005579 [Penicillium manginii]|uniref:uncharacterized protein n=1 Tax=Penicillium manginii TaxID=203109 RepID=UPI0025484403|nr:uncharacterized protein N7533_005579 [Penicillium manginii]KAJ5756036.1 hypothetical protein N7533_005579 [Penicillium manginii]